MTIGLNGQVLAEATELWQPLIAAAGWPQGLLAGLYLAAVWRWWRSASLAAPTSGAGWPAGALLLLAANAVLSLDVWLGQMLRLTAQAQGWYAQRYAPQYLVLAGVLALGWRLGWRAYQHLRAARQPGLALATVGLAALLLLALLRVISAHATDAVLNLHLAGLSVGRALEVISLGLVLWGTGEGTQAHWRGRIF